MPLNLQQTHKLRDSRITPIGIQFRHFGTSSCSASFVIAHDCSSSRDSFPYEALSKQVKTAVSLQVVHSHFLDILLDSAPLYVRRSDLEAGLFRQPIR